MREDVPGCRGYELAANERSTSKEGEDEGDGVGSESFMSLIEVDVLEQGLPEEK